MLAKLCNFGASEFGGEHVARAVDQVVRFIDKDRIIAALFGKESLQRNSRIEEIIVVANDQVSPESRIKREGEGTDVVLASDCFERRLIE